MILLALGGVGLCLGSFINAWVWRLHKNISVAKGRSMCPHCRHQLYARDLIPVLSWIELRGHCRYCRAVISWQYPLVELLTAGLFIVSYLYWPTDDFTAITLVAFGAWLISLVLLVALAVYDIRWMLLPNKLVYPLVGSTAVVAVALAIDGQNTLLGSLAGSLCLSGLFYVLFQVSKGEWIGGGDVKLAIALGFLAGGLVQSILLLFIASLLGTILSLPLLLKSRQASHKVPFGPFLITAGIIVFLWSHQMINWYTQFIEV